MKLKKLHFFCFLISLAFTTVALGNPVVIIENQTNETLKITRPLNTNGRIGLPNPFIQAGQTVEIYLDKIPFKTVYLIKIEAAYANKTNSYFFLNLKPINNSEKIKMGSITSDEEQYALYISEAKGGLYPYILTDDEKTFKVIIKSHLRDKIISDIIFRIFKEHSEEIKH